MAVRITESRIPEGFQPHDLGQVGETVTEQGEVVDYADEKDCYLISYLSSPLIVGQPNAYIVMFNKTSSMLSNDLKYKWYVTNRDNSICEALTSQNSYGEFSFLPPSEGEFTIHVHLLNHNNTEVKRMRIKQYAEASDRQLECFQARSSENNTNMGCIEETESLTKSMIHYIDEALSKDNSRAGTSRDKFIPRRLFIAVMYRVLTSLKSDSLEEAAKELNDCNQDTSRTNFSDMPLGSKYLIPPAFAMIVGPEKNDNSPYKPKTYIDIDEYLIDLNASVNLDLDGKRSERRKKFLQNDLKNMRIDIFNLLRFPKSFFLLCFEFLQILKDKDFNDTPTNLFLQDERACNIVATQFFLGFRINGIITSYEEKKIPQEVKVNISQYMKNPNITIIDTSTLYEARTVTVSITKSSPITGRVIDPIFGRSERFKDIVKLFSFHSEEYLFNDVKTEDDNMVLLDAGFWGHYNRKNPQRDFGMIEGNDVWLCSLESNYSGFGENEYNESLSRLKNEHIRAKMFVKKLWNDYKYICKFRKHTLITNKEDASVPQNRLTIVFPDMHLPEKWPDLFPVSAYNSCSEARNALRAEFEFVNEIPPLIPPPAIAQARRRRIQEYLSNIHENILHNHPFKLIYKELDDEQAKYEYTPAEFVAEMNYYEWCNCMQSSWLYPPFIDLPSINLGLMRENSGDPAPALDLIAILLVIKKMQNEEMCAIKVIQVGDLYEIWMNREWLYKEFPYTEPKEVPKYNQLIRKITRVLGNGIKAGYQYRLDSDWEHWYNSLVDKSSLEAVFKQTNDGKKRPYVFHGWPSNDRKYRRKTGSSINDNETEELKETIERAKNKVRSRIDNIRKHSLPYIAADGHFTGNVYCRDIVFEKLKAGIPDKCLDDYKRNEEDDPYYYNSYLGRFSYEKEDSRKDEYYWNGLILDLLEETGCEMVFGNHEGYRGDIRLNEMLKGQSTMESCQKEASAKPWYNNAGIWAEHGHRWDEYNREGVPFGAAITNLCHFYFSPFGKADIESIDINPSQGAIKLGVTTWAAMILAPPLGPTIHLGTFLAFRRRMNRYRSVSNVDKLKDRLKRVLLDQYYEKLIPGAVLWYLFIKENEFTSFDKELTKFSIYLCGHSHKPDLVKIDIKKEK